MKIILDFQDDNDYVETYKLAFKEIIDEFKGEVVLTIDDYIFASIKTTRDELTKHIIDEYMKEIEARINRKVESFKTFVWGKVSSLSNAKLEKEELAKEKETLQEETPEMVKA